MQINFKPVYGLIDTGTVATCMSESFAKYLKLRLSPSPDAFKLVSANRSPVTAIGVVQADLSNQGLVVPCTFHVLKSLSHNVILGQDFLKSSGAIIDCANNCISLFDGLVNASLTNQRDQTMTLRLAENVTIPPKTQTALRLLVPPRFQNKTSLLETYEPIKNQFLMVARALVHLTNHLTVCCVLNAGQTPQKLRKYKPIARISAVNLNDPHNVALLSIDLRHSAQDSAPNVKTELLSDVEQLPASTLPPYRINLTNPQPVRHKRYPLSPQHEKLLEQYADKLLKAGVVEPSTSPFNSPVLLIKKSGCNTAKPDDLSNLLPIFDFRKVNQQTADEFVPISGQEVFHQIAEAKTKWFTTIDWTSGFNKIHVDPSSGPTTVFSRKTRHLQYTRMAQGLKRSPWHFLSAAYDFFRPELHQHMYCFMDDVLLFHQDFDQHLAILKTIFDKLKRLHYASIRKKVSLTKLMSHFLASSQHLMVFK
jgi:hypothetical protein